MKSTWLINPLSKEYNAQKELGLFSDADLLDTSRSGKRQAMAVDQLPDVMQGFRPKGRANGRGGRNSDAVIGYCSAYLKLAPTAHTKDDNRDGGERRDICKC